jgi:two-component system chemotaxis response regulator CheY
MPKARDLQVLIADDQDSMRRLHRFSLKQIGIHQVTEASNGQEAIGLLRTQKYDLVICDWTMQPIDGLQVFNMMRHDPNLNAVPFLMVTGNVGEQEVRKAIGAGIRLYLGKPYNIVALKQRIEKAVGKLA